MTDQPYNDDVIVVATIQEALTLGARRHGRTLYDPTTGARYLTVHAGSRAVEGLRVGKVTWTVHALNRTNVGRVNELATALATAQARGPRP